MVSSEVGKGVLGKVDGRLGREEREVQGVGARQPKGQRAILCFIKIEEGIASCL